MGGSLPRKRILLVDDYAPFASSLSLALSGDFDVVVASSGAEAWQALAQSFDAVLCDLLMPDLSGLDVDTVRATSPRTASRFVFLTAGAISDETRAHLEECGNRVLRKPFDLQVLSEALGRLWEGEPAARARAAMP